MTETLDAWTTIDGDSEHYLGWRVERLRSLAERLLARAVPLLSVVPRAAAVETKLVLADVLRRDIEAIDLLRTRIHELGDGWEPAWTPPERPAGAALDLARATTGTEVLRRLADGAGELRRAVDAAGDLPAVLDEPTRDVLARVRLLLDQSVAAAARTTPAPEELDVVAAPADPARPMSQPPLPARDARFTLLDPGTPIKHPLAELAPAAQAGYVAQWLLISLEIPTIEFCCRAIQTYDFPFAFVRDMNRQLWDEVRHGQAFLQHSLAMDVPLGEAPATLQLWLATDVDQPELALAIHQRLGERIGIESAFSHVRLWRGLGDDRTAELFAVVAQDEIGHVAIGNRWVRHRSASEDVPRLDERARERRAEFSIASVPRGFEPEAYRRAGFTDEEIELIRLAYQDVQRAAA
ncbi:DUF455 family protein [Micromonospora sp. NPDC049559]|uniref:DUF455 family protein n=1 Tax=Micromonospora sp. NPDC049559 TaxID=3155923 RepID=UPI0034468153